MKINNRLCLKSKGYTKVLFFILLINFIASDEILCQPYPYRFNYLTVDEGLSHTDANDIVQDKQGYIWVATFFGLDRYDGYSIKKYYNTNIPKQNAYKNRIMCIFPDEAANIWMGTEGGLQSFNSKTEQYTDFTDPDNKDNLNFSKIFKPLGNILYGLSDNRIRKYFINGNYITEQKINLPKDVQFSDMAVDKNGLIFLASNKGLWSFDKKGIFKNLPVTGLPVQNLTRLFADNRNNLVAASIDKLFLIVKKTTVKSSPAAYSLIVDKWYTVANNATIKSVTENNRSDYWLNTYGGLVRLDTNFNFIQAVTNKSSQHSLNSNSLTKVFIDRSECLWVGTFGGGLNYCDLNAKLFYTLQHNPDAPNSLSGNHIRSLLEDGENLWIGTHANGLNLYNLKTQAFTYYNSYNAALKLKSDVISSLAFDSDHNLWIGSNAGIEILKAGRKELLKPPGYDQFPTYTIETLVKDCFGNIWFGNHMNRYGVIWKDKLNYYHVKYYDEGYFILADEKKPQLFISSTHGLKRAIIDEERNISKTFHYTAEGNTNSLSANYTYPVCKQNDSIYWIGTIGGGLNRLTLGENNSFKIKSFTGNHGVFKDVESLEIDNSNNIWMGGNGLEYLNPKTEKLIHYDKNDGLQGNSFKVGASCKGADGRLYFGGINGLNYFYPDQIKPNNIDVHPVLTDILINNQKPHFGDPDSSENSIEEAIGYGRDVTLSYLQNNFVISFSSMHFANPLRCSYRYKLLGFDEEWKYTDGKKPGAAYNNLDYKRYKFIVEATNDDGIWGKSHAVADIIITPPWWKSNIAKIFYLLLFISILSGIYIYQARWYRLKSKVAINAVKEKKREEMHQHREELYQQQLMFFTNISHEFRTPLTLILGPLENLMSKNKNTALENAYHLMFKNAKRLINLINELMNFRKVADSKIKLQVQPVIINQFCKDLALDFQNLAIGKNINFKITDHTEKDSLLPLSGMFDIQVLEKILFNLLNNSFKYTNPGGEISFELFCDIENFKPAFENGFQLLNKDYRAKKYMYFRVADTGVGISGDSLPKIFDMYYRTSKSNLGSGIGLALVKSLTQLHKGDIYIYSRQNEGTEMIIGIPWGEENYTKSEHVNLGTNLETQLEVIDNTVLLPLSDESDDENDKNPAVSKIQKRILLVDDNKELRKFLKQTLEQNYFIYEAENGNLALEIASEKIPDLIISDVMMPEMDGIEFCKIIKETFETRHIPFIILSAKDALDTKIEGMESGADFYFAKPLSVELLSLTVHNIFAQGEKLKQRYTNDYLAEATELVHSEKDKAFIHTLLNLIEDNIQDPVLDADFLCEHLFISRTKLYQKIKSISGQSVAEFIRTIRLKKAIQIMTHENIAINEVVDRIGLQSSSNFSRAFKKEYGKSPLQFMQSLKKDSTGQS